MARVRSKNDEKEDSGYPILLAILLAVSGTDVVLYLKFGSFSPAVALIVLSLMPLSIVVIMLSRGSYIRLQRGLKNAVHDIDTRHISRICQLAFLVLIMVAWLSLMLNSEPYDRPLIGFVATAGAITLVAGQILIGCGRVRFILLQICLLGLTIRLMPLSIIPFFFGDDPFLHESLVREIMVSGHIAEGTSYSDFPGMHTHIATTQLVANLGFRTSSIASIVFIQNAVWPIVLYITSVRLFSDPRVGLFAALLLCSSDVITWYGMLGAFPTTFALTLLLFVVFILSKRDWQPRDFLVIMVMTILLLLSHTLTALVLVIVLLVFLVLHTRFGRQMTSNTSKNFLINTTIGSAILVFGYWIYSADFVFDRLIKIVFMREGVMASFATEAGTTYAASISITEYVLDLTSQFILACLAMVGLLAVYSAKSLNMGRTAILIGLLFFIFGGAGQAFALGFAPDRWLYYAYVFLPIGGGLGLAAIWKMRRLHVRRTLAIIVSVFVIFSFLSISDSRANNDSPLYSLDLTSPRYIMYSELNAADLLIERYDGSIGSDNDLGSYIKSRQKDRDVRTISFDSVVYEEYSDMLIVRQHFDRDPVYSRGLYRITYDIEYQMEYYYFSLIVDAGTAQCYLR